MYNTHKLLELVNKMMGGYFSSQVFLSIKVHLETYKYMEQNRWPLYMYYS
jgi:hypothetical protein